MNPQDGDARPEASRPGVESRIPRSCDPPCTPDNRCAEHHIDVDPESIGDLLRRLFGGDR